MCSQGIERRRSDPPDCSPVMESSAASSPAAPDEPPRVKFLCSFGGSILPRPLDGRLRYVGGETRIVSLPRDVPYHDLLARMRELFEGTAVIKYQQPDEDIDALVSVVNDDDVMNMMEEYDKLGAAGDGFTRLRIFLFSQQHPELDPAAAAASHYDVDERETERRYVDALNSLSDTKSPSPSPDAPEQFSGPPGLECGIHSQVGSHHLNIPIPHQLSHGLRYGEVEGPWSPAYFSPGRHPAHELREFPPSLSSARFHLASGEFNDRIPDEYNRQSPAQYDHQSPHYMENAAWLPPGAIVQEKSGFPSNLGATHNVFEGSSICEHCRIAFQRNPAAVSDPRYLDPRWKHGQPLMEQSSTGKEYMSHFSNSCTNCYRDREAYMLNQDVKLDHGVYVKDQSEHHRPLYNEAHGHDRGWVLHHHQDPRVQLSGSSRVSEHYVVDGNVMNAPFPHGNFYEGHSVSSNCINHEDSRFPRLGTELGNEVFHAQQAVGGGPQAQIPGFEDATIRFGNRPAVYGVDNLYQVQQNLSPIQSIRRKAQVPVRPGMPYESPGMMMPNGGMHSSFIRSPQDVSPRLSRIVAENQIQNSWAGQNGSTSQKILGFDGSAAPDYLYDPSPRPNQNIIGQDGRLSVVPDTVQCQPGMVHVEVPSEAVPPSPTLADDTLVASTAFGYHPFSQMGGTDVSLRMRVSEEKNPVVEMYETKDKEIAKEFDMHARPSPNEKQNLDFGSNKLRPPEEDCYTANLVGSDANAANEHGDISVECLRELIDSVKKAALESAEVVKARVEANADENVSSFPAKKESSSHELEAGNACVDLEANSDRDGEHQKISKIEPTTAEAEALAKGLQTIRNDDLEEIRALGSGTYGAVYHGKWKGSDVAIKRIKASCFVGRPSERERLIADFWKEALILSSLHHPNVVSFYGVVRDGPDGSLATVTEFMVNGSLKQFLQKKDRTIDRRKRLIIAMDAAFGMEYLHGKNIVHFDIKCENLLVNMRDPHRPVCKIGDLGLSKVKQHTLVSGGVRGTLPWMAPELLSGKSNMVTEKIDVYSFGIVMWELLTGEEPYADIRCASIIGGIVNNTLRPQIPTWCDPEWKALMESCWSSDPGERPSFSEISQKLRKMAAAINVK